MTNKKDCRDWAKGIYVKNTIDGSKLVATNGHILMEISLNGSLGHKEEFFLTLEQLDPVLRMKGDSVVHISPNGIISVSVLSEDKTKRVELLDIPLKDNDIKIPSYERIIPDSYNNIGVSFNIDYLVAFSKAKKLLLSKGPLFIRHNGNDKASLVDFDMPEVRAIIMPIRDNRLDDKENAA